MKTGLKSSEFWLASVTMVVSLLVMLGFVEPTNSTEVSEMLSQAVAGVVALGSLISYILSRTELKKEEMRNQVKG